MNSVMYNIRKMDSVYPGDPERQARFIKFMKAMFEEHEQKQINPLKEAVAKITEYRIRDQKARDEAGVILTKYGIDKHTARLHFQSPKKNKLPRMSKSEYDSLKIFDRPEVHKYDPITVHAEICRSTSILKVEKTKFDHDEIYDWSVGGITIETSFNQIKRFYDVKITTDIVMQEKLSDDSDSMEYYTEIGFCIYP